MNLDKVNKWLTLVANFGVVAGIFFLAIEIRQNQESLNQSQEVIERQFELQTIESHQVIADSYDELRLLFASDAEAARLWLDGNSGIELSEVDLMRYQGLCQLSIWNDAVAHRRVTAFNRTEEALFIEAAFRSKIDDWPGFRLCWEKARKGLEDWGYGSLVKGIDDVGLAPRLGPTP